MSDQSFNQLIGILPAPQATVASDNHWIIGVIIALLILIAATVYVLRSRRCVRILLRRQIIKRQIDSRSAAAALIELAQGADENLLHKLQQIRFGPQPADPQTLLKLLRRIP